MALKLWNTSIKSVELWGGGIKSINLWDTAILGWGVASAPSNWLLNDLVSYYKCDTNGSFPDIHGSNNWTISGATYTASWKINGWYDFDWVNDSINSNYTPSISAFTIAGWINSDDSWSTKWIYSTNTNSWADRKWVNLNTTSGKFQALLWTATWAKQIDSTTLVSNSTWYHVWCTYDWTNFRLYVNWSEEWTSLTWTLSSHYTSLIFWPYYASLPTALIWNWKQDEFWIRDTALTDDNFTDLYNDASWLAYSEFTS